MPGFQLRHLKHGDEVIPYVFCFRLDNAAEILGVPPDLALQTLRLMLEAGDLATYGQDGEHLLTRPVSPPRGGTRTQHVVIRNRRNALGARLLGRARRYDDLQRRRAENPNPYDLLPSALR